MLTEQQKQAFYAQQSGLQFPTTGNGPNFLPYGSPAQGMGVNNLFGQPIHNGFWPPVNINGSNGADAWNFNPSILSNQPNIGAATANATPNLSVIPTVNDAIFDHALQILSVPSLSCVTSDILSTL